MNKIKRYKILHRFQEKNPNPKIEIIYNTKFELLISILLSAKTTDFQVNKVTKKLFKIANSPEKIIELGIEKLKRFLKPIGLFRKKSEYIIKICQLLINYDPNNIPCDFNLLKSFPGIGRKTANLILNVAFNFPTIAVDTHVFRVSNRTNFVKEKNINKMEKKLLLIVPKKFKINFHHWFVLHGKTICVASRPLCKICFINDLCEYKKKYFLSNKCKLITND